MGILVKFEGILGDKTNGKDKGWFAFDSMSHGAGRPAPVTGASHDRYPTNSQEVLLTGPKYIPGLVLSVASGRPLGKVDIDLRGPKGRGLVYHLANVIGTSYKVSDKGAKGVATYSLNYTKYTVEQIE